MSEPIKQINSIPIAPEKRPEYEGPHWYHDIQAESRKQQAAEAARKAARKEAIAATLPPPIITFDPDLLLVVKAVTEGLVESGKPVISISALDDDNSEDLFDFEQGLPIEIKILPQKENLGGYGLAIVPFGDGDIEVRIIDPNHAEPWILRSGKNNNSGNKIYFLGNFPAFEAQIGELLKRRIINFTSRNLRTLLDLTKKTNYLN